MEEKLRRLESFNSIYIHEWNFIKLKVLHPEKGINSTPSANYSASSEH
jgi:hypothetical protein